MKWIKLYESFEDIDSICKKYGIENYTINSDGTVDIYDRYVNLYRKGLTKLPLKFGKVSNDFTCHYNNLISLEGCPQSIGGDFSCVSNNLTTLEGCPKSVGGYFSCTKNFLTTLEGSPQSIGDHFDCMDNKLISLEGCPQSVGSDFNCSYNHLTTLEGCLQSVRDFNCGNNYLTTLEGCPKSVGGYFHFMNNQLKDLYGFPEFFNGNIDYDSNPVSEILDLFNTNRLGKVIDLLNEYGVIQQDGKVVILDRLEEVFHTLNLEIPEEINLKNYEVY